MFPGVNSPAALPRVMPKVPVLLTEKARRTRPVQGQDTRVPQDQGPAGNRGWDVVGQGIGEGQDAAAVGQAAGAAQNAGVGRSGIAAEVQRQAAAAEVRQGDVAAAGKAAQVGRAEAGRKGHAAGGHVVRDHRALQGIDVAQLNRAVRDGRRPGVGIGGIQHQQAAAGHGQGGVPAAVVYVHERDGDDQAGPRDVDGGIRGHLEAVIGGIPAGRS